jgi:predicted Rossmann-fold nucleotide-binding protein
MKLAVVGSRSYTNEKKIKRLLELYRERYGDALIVVSGGCPDGADALAKKVALEMGIQYAEFPPKHRCHNMYCINPPEEYAKPYHVSNFFARNTQIAEYCEHLAAFTLKGVRCNGTMDTFGKAEKMGKKCSIYEDEALERH